MAKNYSIIFEELSIALPEGLKNNEIMTAAIWCNNRNAEVRGYKELDAISPDEAVDRKMLNAIARYLQSEDIEISPALAQYL